MIKREEQLHYYLLLKAANIGPRGLAKLTAAGINEAQLRRAPAHVAAQIGLSPARLQVLSDIIARADILIPKIEQTCQQLGLSYLLSDDADYPPLLQQIADPPYLLFVAGHMPESWQSPLAVVGSRTPSPYGRAVLPGLLEPVAQAGAEIISGLAYGIDKLAHEICLATSGCTVAVMGGGHSHIYPSAHRQLAEQIIDRSGAVISEFLPNQTPRKDTFPLRNRIIAGLSQAVFIVEAKERSGALITARLALEANRDVCALPGDVTRPQAVGPNRLIQQGAAPILAAPDLLDVLGLPSAQPVNETSGSPLLLAVRQQPGITLDELALQAHSPVHQLLEELSSLEIDGQIKKTTTGGYNCL